MRGIGVDFIKIKKGNYIMPYDLKLLFKVAELYYKDDLKQKCIARKLKISKYKVSRILRKAREKGLVHIEIIQPEDMTIK